MEHEEQLGETSRLHQDSDGSERPTMGDALAYLKVVKEVFKDTPHKYDQFLAVIKAFHAQRLDTVDVIIRLKPLFKRHHFLIFGLNTFLSKDYQISFPFHDDPTRLYHDIEFEQATKYVNKIKTRFQNEIVYQKFGDILDRYRFGDILDRYRILDTSIDEVYGEVEELFYPHQDLIEEFPGFLRHG